MAVFSILLSPLAPLLAETSRMFCVFKEITGLPCPGCGTTRAALALARLEVFGAFASYPLQSAVWTFFVVGGLAAGLWTVMGRELPRLPRRLPRRFVALAVALVLANWGYCIATGV